jgi:hypothetical protein
MNSDPNFNSIDDIFPSEDPISEAHTREARPRSAHANDYNFPLRHTETGERSMSRRKTVSYPEEHEEPEGSEDFEGSEEPDETEEPEGSDDESIDGLCVVNNKKEKFSENKNESLLEWAKNVAFVIAFIFLVTFLFTSHRVKKIIDKALKIDSEKDSCYGTAHKLIIAGCTSSATLVFAFLLRYLSNYSQQKH